MARSELASAEWNLLECIANPLDLEATLTSGQSFRWRRHPNGIWWGSIGDVFAALWQAPGDPASPLYWQTFPWSNQHEAIRAYFRLEVPLEDLYASWIEKEPAIADAVREHRGLRILRQPPVECFFAFQCATCNTVVKIQRSVYRLGERYGVVFEIPPIEPPYGVSAEDPHGRPAVQLPPAGGRVYGFPSIERLSSADEEALRTDLWGYRAPRVISLAQRLGPSGGEWLLSLRDVPYARAKQELLQFEGIGEKLADCICLFCLDKDEAVPVDTHVRQIACRLFLRELTEKSLTPRVYAAISDAFRERFGEYAGWAQQYLFLGAMRRRRRQLE